MKNEENICEQCGGPSEGMHSCPYAEEINDDYDEEYCNCCDECMQECLADI